MTAYVTLMIMMLTIVLYMSKDSELAFAAAQRLTWTNPRDDAEEQNDNIFYDSSDGEPKFFYEGKNTYGETVNPFDKTTGTIDPNAEQRGCIANPNGGACVASDVLVKTIGVDGLASANGGFDQVSPVYLGGEKTLNPLNGYEPEATAASEERILFSCKETPEQEAALERIKEATNRRYAREEAAKNATWAGCIPAICVIAAFIAIVLLAVHLIFH